MSGVYVVVSTRDGEVEVCETYAGQQSAVSCVREISGDTFNHYPVVEVDSDNSIQWKYVNNPHHTVSIYWKPIRVDHISKSDVDNLLGHMFSAINDDGSIKASALISVPVVVANDTDELAKFTNEEFARSETMPGGFDWNDKPVFSVQLFEDPESVKPTEDLTQDQRWALVTARYKKMFQGFERDVVLLELKNKTALGQHSVDRECELLDRLRGEQIDTLYKVRDY
jgi:hypothetical protein